MEKAICANCGKVITSTSDFVWLVDIIDEQGQKLSKPCCCEPCAIMTQEYYAEIHRKRMEYIEKQHFQKSLLMNA